MPAPPTQTAAWESPAKYGNDGTRERAGEFARANPAIKVIGEITRRGKGRGIREAVALGDIIGFADADNKVPIEEFGKLQPWLAAGFEVVIGSRGLPDSATLSAARCGCSTARHGRNAPAPICTG